MKSLCINRLVLFAFSVFLLPLMAGPAGGADAPPLPTYYCYRTLGPIEIDGVLDEQSWEKALSTGAFVQNDGVSPGRQKTEAKLLWDDQYLYFAFECADEVIWSTKTARDDSLWQEEVVEVFIDADGDGRNYIELEVNPLNTFIDIYLLEPIKPLRYESWNSVYSKTAVVVDGSLDDESDKDVSWTVEMRLPFHDVATAANHPPKSGDSWRVNLYRIDRKPSRESLAWSPTLGRTFHTPARFGNLVFASRPAGSRPPRQPKARASVVAPTRSDESYKIYILTDLEGVAGVVDFQSQTYSTGKYYEGAKKLLTAEINAAVDGILSTGDHDILVVDAHGAGGIVPEELDPRVKLLHGRPFPQDFGLGRGFDAMFIVGQHARNLVATGDLSHSYSSREIGEITLNGKPVGEIDLMAAIAGELGIPTVFLSGDKDAVDELLQIVPDAVGVSVKEGLTRTTAITVSPAVSRRLIRRGAAEAVGKIGSIKPYKVTGPQELIIEWLTTTMAERDLRKAGTVRLDERRIARRGKNIFDVLFW